ncbi:hypothetical protein E4U47_003628 [Claviceps purpurea]|nr:hypothetical protein E4U47_003628 [Claviceps purpurea]
MTKTSNSSTGGSSKGDKKRKRGTRDALAPSPEPHSLIRKNGVQRRGKKKAATAGDATQEQLVASAVRSTSVPPESKKCKRRKTNKKVKESHDSEDGAGPSSNATSSKEEIDAAATARHEWSRLEQVLGLCSMIAEAIGPLGEVVEEEEKNRSILAKKMDIASLEKLMAAKMRCESLGL